MPVPPSTQALTSGPGFPGQSQLDKGALQWPPQGRQEPDSTKTSGSFIPPN